MRLCDPNNVGRAVQMDLTLLSDASTITEQKKCWELLTQKFDVFILCAASPNNTQQQATGCANGCNMLHPTMLRPFAGAKQYQYLTQRFRLRELIKWSPKRKMLSSFLKFSQLILYGNVLRSLSKICLWIWEYYYVLNTGFIMFIATHFMQACNDNYKWFNHLILLPHHNVGRYTISQHPTKLKESETKIQQVIKALPSSKCKVTIIRHLM